jgi:hypothetical protein
MFRVKYKIVTEQLKEIKYISDEEIRYNFLLGNASLLSSNAEIEMKWEWIPLLDFAHCLQMIVSNLQATDIVKEYFEFTENAETLEFSRQREQLKIVASFSSIVIETTFADFEKAVYDFHFNISEYIRSGILGEPPSVLQKYLSLEF